MMRTGRLGQFSLWANAERRASKNSKPPQVPPWWEDKNPLFVVMDAATGMRAASQPAEAALPGYEAVLHYGIVAPAGTPRAIIDKLSVALRAAVMSDDLKAKLAQDGAEPLPSTPEEYAADIDREETKWSAIIKKSGAKAE